MSRAGINAALLSLALGGASLGLGIPSASAATYTVTVAGDDFDNPIPGSLRYAIEEANANPGQDLITIAPGLTVTLDNPTTITDGTDIVSDPDNPATIKLSTLSTLHVDTQSSAQQFSLQHLIVDGEVRVYHAPQNVLIDGVTLRAGDMGNQLQSEGPLTIRNSKFEGTDDYLYSFASDCSKGVISITDTTFNGGDTTEIRTACDVRLERVSTTDRQGGAVVSARDVDVIDSTFSNNLARGLTLEQSRSVNVTGSSFEKNLGGLERMRQEGPLTIERSTFRGNTSDSNGGAVLLPASETETLTVIDSVFANNSAAARGGAIYIDSADLNEPDLEPAITILRSTFSGNRAIAGKSLYVGEIETSTSSAHPVGLITNSTFDEPEDPAITGNEQDALEAGTGSVIYGFEETERRPALWLEHVTIVGGGITIPYTGAGATVRVTNSVIDSGPFAAFALTGPDPDEKPELQGQGNYATRPGPLAPYATTATRAQLALAPLADNGGRTPTRLPNSTSVLIDSGVTSPITNDQRLVARDSRPDVGAVEVRVPTVSIEPLVQVTEGNPGRFTVRVSGPADNPGSVRVSTRNNTALAGTDYTAASAVVNWPAGAADVSRTFEVATLLRPGAQGERELTVRLTDPNGGRLGDTEGRLVIRDAADPSPTTTPTPTSPTTEPTRDNDGDNDDTPTATPSDPSGPLPDTGASVGPMAVLLGLALLLAGVIVAAVARRRGAH